VVNLSDLNGVVSQEVVDDEGEIIEATVEAEDTSIVIKELLLRLHAPTTERSLHVLLQRGVTDNGPGDLALREAINGDGLRFSLREALRLKELSCVLIAVVDADAASKDAYIEAYSEITWEHGEA